jgi:polysaccharide export outer membrane protein
MEEKKKVRQTLYGFALSLCVLLFFSELPKLSAQDKPASTPRQSETKAEVDKPAIGEDYVIGLEDVLSINVWKEPELSLREVVVRPDGKISLPLISDIQVSGLTPKQLQQQISEKLKEFVASPNVTVTVIKALSQTVSVVGEVNRPGTYPLGSPITVLELLARAGGVTELARAKDIKIIRKEKGKTLQIPFNYKEILKGYNLQQNIALKNGDVLLVP